MPSGAVRDYCFSIAWGVNPSVASGSIVGEASLRVGDPVTYAFGSVASFPGVISEAVQSEEFGMPLTTFTVVDNRIHLARMTVYGAWNIEDDLGLCDPQSGARARRYRHLLPGNNWKNGIWTYTDSPMKTKAILDSAFAGAEGGMNFARNYHRGLNDGILTGLDYSSGTKLSNFISEINGKTGLEVGISGASTLVWCRKGEGLAYIPTAADRCPYSEGLSLTSADTAIRVVGGRIRVQKLNVDLEPDWNPAWNPYIEETTWRRAVAAVSEIDSETKTGQLLLSAYARKITVAHFAAAAGDDSLLDNRRFGRVARNQLPAWTYINELVYRSYRIPESFSINGTPLASLDFADSLIKATDIADGVQVLATPVQYYPSCQASAIVRGQPLDLINSNDIRSFYHNIDGDLRSAWSAAPDFEVDAIGKSIRFATPVFIDGSGAQSIYLQINRGEGGGENLEGKVADESDYLDVVVPNPDFVITPAQVRASFCFLAGPFYYDAGSGPSHGAIASSGLDQHLIDVGDGQLVEVPYEDGETATQKARQIASSALEASYIQVSGGFTRHGSTGTSLTPFIDRVTVKVDIAEGITESVEYTKARSSGVAFSERTLQRIQRSEELFSGQETLKREIREYRLLAAAVSGTAAKGASGSRTHQALADVFEQPVGGGGAAPKRITNTHPPEGGWRAGDIVWVDPAGVPVADGGSGSFGGVVVCTPRATDSEMVVASSGRVPVRVKGGIPINSSIMGIPGNPHGDTGGSVVIGRLAHGEATPETTSGTLLAMVDLGIGSSPSLESQLIITSARPAYIPAGTPKASNVARFYVTWGMVNGVLPTNWSAPIDVPTGGVTSRHVHVRATFAQGSALAVASCEIFTLPSSTPPAPLPWSATGARPASYTIPLGAIYVDENHVAREVNTGAGSIHVSEHITDIANLGGVATLTKALAYIRLKA